MIDEGGGAGKPAEEEQKLCSLMILIQLTIVLLSIWHFHWFSHQQSYVEREGSEQTNVEENYDHQIPLPRHASPQQIFFQLKIISSVKNIFSWLKMRIVLSVNNILFVKTEIFSLVNTILFVRTENYFIVKLF